MKFSCPTLASLLAMASLTSCNQLASLPSTILSLPAALLNAPSKLLGKEDKKKKALEELAKAEQKQTAERLGATAVGEVSYVDEESGFILIKQTTGKKILPSTRLLARTPTGTITARLTASLAAKGSFLAADIVSGKPERGNPILVDPDAKPAKEQETTPHIPSVGEKDAAQPVTDHARVAPKLEPILPPLEDFRDSPEAPALPSLEQ